MRESYYHYGATEKVVAYCPFQVKEVARDNSTECSKPHRKNVATYWNKLPKITNIYLAVFYEEEQTKCKVIDETMLDALAKETERQLDQSSTDSSHVGYTETWAKEHGKRVYQG